MKQINTTKKNKIIISNINCLATAAVLNTKICEVENKIHDVTGLATTAVLNIKIDKFENKIPDLSKLIKKADYEAKITDIKEKYFITAEYNKIMRDILDTKIKEKKLVNESNITNLI